MEIPSNCAANLVSEIAKFMFFQIKRRISYVFHHKREVENFEEKVQRLKERRERVQHDVDAAKRNVEKIEIGVENWLIKVDKMIDEEAKETKDLEDKAKNKCFIGLCPNFKSRYQLSKKAEKDANAVDVLLRQGEFDKVSYRDPPQAMVYASPKDFEAFDSRKQVFDEIMEALKDPSINIIGVYGMAGVGKTTLVKEVAKQIKGDKLFDSVVMAHVTQTLDIQKMQDQIAEPLGLKIEEKSVAARASRLHERLKGEKKILVVLDDIWARLELNKVGIPVGDEHKGCNILLTSRNLDVSLNGMDVQKKFRINVLKEEEAWELFKKMAGNGDKSPELPSIATEVAKKCAGLPIAVSTVATALRNKDSFEWEDALRQLQRPSSSNFSEVPEEAYAAIELSYNHLKGEELKQTFLLCSLLGHNVAIQDMLKYSMGLGLFHGVNTVEEARKRLLTVVSKLKTSCLLLDSYTELHFDMHDLIRDVAISIASRDNRVFALNNEDVPKDWPNVEAMKSWDKIGLRYAINLKLPDQLKCPKLTFFYMGSRDPSMEMPTNFFKETKNLKVLDLTEMHFPSLPSSISLLSNLGTLCLDQCVLGDIAIIGELKNLEILSLLDSDIKMLPEEIGKLIKLKLLDLHGCTKLKRITPGILSSLSRLEELYMGNSRVQWEAEGHTQPSNASFAEFKALSCLTTLDVCIPNAKIIPKDLFFENLQIYRIFIGEAWDWDGQIGYSRTRTRTLKLKLDTGIEYLSYGLKMLLNKAENLHLDEMTGVKILLHESEYRESFRMLKNLHIQNGALVQYIIKDNDIVDKIEFLQLQSLILQDLPKLISFCSENNSSTSISPKELPLFNDKIMFPKLEKLKLSSINIERIWHYQPPRGSYSMQNLTSLIIEGCDKLKHILSYSMAECLQQLQSFEVIGCRCIQQIVAMEEIKEDGKRATISFPLLNSLKLKALPKLIGFCHENYFLEFPSLKILEVEHCLELKGFINKSMSKDITIGSTTEALFNEQVAFPNLEKVTISHLRNVKRLWYNQLHTDSFCQMKELKTEYCDELLNIFPSSVLGVFQRLEILTVTDCELLEEVFELQAQELEIKDTYDVTFQLKQMYLLRLPKLKHVWNRDPHGNISFQNLQGVDVWQCRSLKSVFPFSIAKGLPQLERLLVQECGVEEIVSKGMHTTVWPVLKNLKTYGCKEMEIFGQLESNMQKPLFHIEKVIPQLEVVWLSSDDIAMICGGQFPENLFCHIKVLGISCESAIYPFSFLRRFYNLEELLVGHCNFKELSPSEGNVGEEKEVWMLPKIKKLVLYMFPRLTQLWKQESPLGHICARLETLDVWRCDSLINLGVSSASFENLTSLYVRNCKGMVELITSSEVQSLMRLVTMSIRECEMVKEVVASEADDEATYEIIFTELKCLELHCLASLRSFCSGDHTFKFPSLEQVIVSQCPRLTSFCQGAISTPKLQRVQLAETDHNGRWAGDLNVTIEQLYMEQNVQIFEEETEDTI
ncbi:PREDICTED: disease resistance protein At4g27190 isoform X2 [Theobroma cacao]|uniref:Disease resistance protein At4g27190 isoform X2 n=1 Tax=Theobroma cacao TaxID=3641 RepID=A0AB32WJ81_THECC|nr:PREDICTED: disease resistance protein At4g27190 isoform X2 [Theobroma cacao]